MFLDLIDANDRLLLFYTGLNENHLYTPLQFFLTLFDDNVVNNHFIKYIQVSISVVNNVGINDLKTDYIRIK